MHAAVEGAATSRALVDIHVSAASASLRKCLSEHSGLVDDVAASTFISEEAKIKELRKLQQRYTCSPSALSALLRSLCLQGLIWTLL